jgi:hypothetical protein
VKVFKHFQVGQWLQVADRRLGKLEASKFRKIAKRQDVINERVLKLKITKRSQGTKRAEIVDASSP